MPRVNWIKKIYKNIKIIYLKYENAIKFKKTKNQFYNFSFFLTLFFLLSQPCQNSEHHHTRPILFNLTQKPTQQYSMKSKTQNITTHGHHCSTLPKTQHNNTQQNPKPRTPPHMATIVQPYLKPNITILNKIQVEPKIQTHNKINHNIVQIVTLIQTLNEGRVREDIGRNWQNP